MKIIPAIDIIKGKTVRLEQGEYDRELKYDMTPVEAAMKWEMLGAELIHVVDLDGARSGLSLNLSVIREITRAVNVPVQAGGGFRKEVDIKDALSHGVWRVVIGSKAFSDIDFARDCIENFHEQIIFSMDVRDFKPRVEGWKKALKIDIIDVIKKFISFGAKEIIYTDIQKDGMLLGPSIVQLKRILTSVNIKVISAGGVKDISHIKELKKLELLGLSGVIVGRALYDGTMDLEEAINAGKTDNTMS